MNPICFKSIPRNFEKEKDGRKPNTFRTWDSYIEHLPHLPNTLDNPPTHPTRITIENTETHETFTREIIDITEFERWVIISWKHESAHHEAEEPGYHEIQCGSCGAVYSSWVRKKQKDDFLGVILISCPLCLQNPIDPEEV